MLTTTGTLMLVAGMAAAGSQIAGGISASDAANQQASLQEEQAKIALDESNQQATQKATERRKFLAEQRMAYVANGVSLAGTPGIVENDTFNEFQQEIDALRKSGAAQYGYAMKQAAVTKASGRAQLISGILSGISSAGSTLYSVNSLGKK